MGWGGRQRRERGDAADERLILNTELASQNATKCLASTAIAVKKEEAAGGEFQRGKGATDDGQGGSG